MDWTQEKTKAIRTIWTADSNWCWPHMKFYRVEMRQSSVKRMERLAPRSMYETDATKCGMESHTNSIRAHLVNDVLVVCAMRYDAMRSRPTDHRHTSNMSVPFICFIQTNTIFPLQLFHSIGAANKIFLYLTRLDSATHIHTPKQPLSHIHMLIMQLHNTWYRIDRRLDWFVFELDFSF